MVVEGTQPESSAWVRRAHTGLNGAKRPKRKRAEIIAAEIEADILKRGWPVGTVIGSEAELIERYEVSRSVFREAIRLLEHHLVAEMRRGRNGGLVVARPDPGVVADAVALYLRYRRVEPKDLYEVRQSLEMASVRLAAERASEEDIERFRELGPLPEHGTPDELAQRFSAFHEAVAEMSGNPAVHLYVQVIYMLAGPLVNHAPAEKVAEDVHRAHAAIAEAIAAGDAALAQRRMLRHFEAAEHVGYT